MKSAAEELPVDRVDGRVRDLHLHLAGARRGNRHLGHLELSDGVAGVTVRAVAGAGPGLHGRHDVQSRGCEGIVAGVAREHVCRGPRDRIVAIFMTHTCQPEVFEKGNETSRTDQCDMITLPENGRRQRGRGTPARAHDAHGRRGEKDARRPPDGQGQGPSQLNPASPEGGRRGASSSREH